MDILFVGQNPSFKNTNFNVPFVGCPSHDRLLEWIQYLKVNGETHLINVSNTPGKMYLDDATMDDFGPRLLHKFLDIEDKTHDYKIIALGQLAHEALSLINIEHFTLPHPSGRNRKLNDKKYVVEILNECYAYINEGD